jgi:hypothetical protein
MKTVWGLLLIGCGLMISQPAHAKEWTPFIGVSLLPNINSVYTEYDATAHHEENALIMASTNGSFIVSAGLEKDHWSILIHYYGTKMPGTWTDFSDSAAYVSGQPTIETYEMREWGEFHIASGARYSPRLPLTARSKLYLGAGIAFGKVAYVDESNTVDEHGSHGDRIRNKTYRDSRYFFKQYGEIGISTQMNKNINMIVGFTLQHALVPLDEKKLNPYIHNNVENWVAGFEVGILYYLR